MIVYMGLLGMIGLMVFFGLFDVGKFVLGDIVVVFGVVGVIGLMVG